MMQTAILAIVLVAALAIAGRRLWTGIRAATGSGPSSPACQGCPNAETCSGAKGAHHESR